MISALKFNKKVAAKSSNLSLFFSQNDADLDDAATVLSTELTFDLSSSSFQFCQEEATWSWHKNHDPFVKDQWFISTGPFVKDHQAKVLNKSLALSAANATIFDIYPLVCLAA